MNVQEEKLLRTGAVAQLLQVTQMTLKRWAESGILVPVKISDKGYKLYSKQQINDFINLNIETQTLTYDSKTLTSGSENNKDSKKRRIINEIHDPDGSVVTLFEGGDNKDEINDYEEHFLEQDSDSNNDTKEVDKSTEKNVNIKLPSTKRMPNDKTRKSIFNVMPIGYVPDTNIINMEFKEKSLSKKKKGFITPIDVITRVNLEYPKNLILDELRLKPFDGEVLDACVSLQANHNQFTTIDAIYRLMIGSVDSHKQPSTVMENIIKTSLDKLMFCKVRIDLTEACRHLGYNCGEPVILHNALIPGCYVENVKVYGQKTTIVEFYDVSPLFRIAEIKNGQIISYPVNMLDAPVQNSPAVIVMKNYLARRIIESTIHKKMRPIVTFKDLFDKAELFNLNKQQRCRYFQALKIICDYFVSYGVLKSYEFRYQNGAYYSIDYIINPNFKEEK